jgi:GT2 family glycosyltransferase
LETTYPRFEVVFVDNASTDGSYDLVEQEFGRDPRLKIVRSPENSGFSAGNNLGFSKSRGDYVAFLNNDTVVNPCWLSRLVDAFNRDPEIGLAQSLIVNLTNGTIQSAGWLYSDYLQTAYAIAENQPISTKLSPVFDVSFVFGAAMMVDRKIVETVGLFEPQIPFYYDDTLLSFKTLIMGKRVVTVSASVVRHAGGDATKNVQPHFRVFNGLKAKSCLLFDIHYQYNVLAKALFLFTVSIVNETSFNLLNKRSVCVVSQSKALCWCLLHFRLIWRNRLKHWSHAKIPPKRCLPNL